MLKLTRGTPNPGRIKKSNFIDDLLWIILIGISCYLLIDHLRTPKANIAANDSNSNSTDRDIGEYRLSKAVQAIKNSEETTFDLPIFVAWEGNVTSMFSSGSDYGIKKIPADKDFPDFYVSTGSEENLDLDGKIKIYGYWTGITCAYQNTAFHHCVPIVEAKKIVQSGTINKEIWNPAGKIYHTKAELCNSLPHKNPPEELIKEYRKNLQSPFIKHIRKSLNLFLSNTDKSCSERDCFHSRLQAYNDLEKIETEYLKSKFVILNDDIALFGGESMLILFEDKPDQIFYVWVYDFKDGTYDLRGFEKYKFEDANLNIQQIQKDFVDIICSGKFGI